MGVDGQMGISGCGQDGTMAEDLLNFDQIDAGFDQMGRIAVAQTSRSNLFFIPQSATTVLKVV